MEPVEERFMRYVRVNTQSKEGQEQIPSTPEQWDLAHLLVEELRALGVADARVDDHCYVMGSIPSNLPEGTEVASLGLIAHMDTATETSGKNVNPCIVENYQGGPIVLNEELGVVMDPAAYTGLAKHLGDDLIVTDGTTLLGADDKAGIAEIMAVVEYLREHPEMPHGKVCIGFTPDEEVGRGPDLFDIEAFGADYAYTIDGGELGELEYENFNAAHAVVAVTGEVVHPGSSKGRMRNAALVAMRFNELLPPAETPTNTEGREGFFHLLSVEGDVASATLHYAIRDHSAERFAERKELLHSVARLVNEQLRCEAVTVEVTDQYYNMKDRIAERMELVEVARAAMEECGVEPLVIPVRGGTDGAQLSYKGLLCPNICSGCEYAHGPYEHVSVRALRTIAEVLVALVRRFAEPGAVPRP